MGVPSAPLLIIGSYRSIFSTADFFFDQMRAPLASLSIIGPYRSNFDFFQLKWLFEANVIWRFLMIFISKNIFIYFPSGIEYWILFHFILSIGWINKQFWLFIHSWNRVIWKSEYWWLNYYKNSEKLYLDNKSVITNIGCIRTINLNQKKCFFVVFNIFELNVNCVINNTLIQLFFVLFI